MTNLSPNQIKLVNIFQDKFQPLTDPIREKLLLSTADVFAKFQQIWPSEEYTEHDAYVVMSYCEVPGVNGAGSKYFWMFQELD